MSQKSKGFPVPDIKAWMIENPEEMLEVLERIKPTLEIIYENQDALTSLQENAEQAFREAERIFPLFASGKLSDFAALEHVNGLTLLVVCSMIDGDSQSKAKKILRTDRAKSGAEGLHGQPGGSREKADKLRAVYLTGNYSTKVCCVRKEHEKLNMTYDTAIRALSPKKLEIYKQSIIKN